MEPAVDRRADVSARLAHLRARTSLTALSDGDVLVLIGDGDRSAFDELHRRYSRAVLGLAINRLRDRGQAEDAVQDAFTSIWRAARTYRPDLGPGAPWVYAIARNAITSRWRKNPEPAAEPRDEPSLEAGPAELAEQSWRSFLVHRALETLPVHQRRLVELAYWGDLSQSEIAAELDLPLGTVKTRTRAALKRLAAALREDLQ